MKELTPKQYARQKDISLRTVYRHIKAGKLTVKQKRKKCQYTIILR